MDMDGKSTYIVRHQQSMAREFMNEIPYSWLMMSYGKMKETRL